MTVVVSRRDQKISSYKNSLPDWDHVIEIHAQLFLHNFGKFVSVCPSVFESLVFQAMQIGCFRDRYSVLISSMVMVGFVVHG